MNIEEKKALRNQKLKELYDFNEQNAGREAMIKYADLRNNEEEKMEHLAYEYLAQKGFINYKVFGGNNLYQAKITAYGIDYVENEL